MRIREKGRFEFRPFFILHLLWTTRGKKWLVRKRILRRSWRLLIFPSAHMREMALLVAHVAVELLLRAISEQVQMAAAAETRIR